MKNTRTSNKETHVHPEGIVSLRDVFGAMQAAARGELKEVPAWAGKASFANEKAQASWEARYGREGMELPVPAAEMSSFVKLFSENNELLALVASGQAVSVAELARRLHRAPSNVGRTLGKLERYGVLRMKQSGPRSKTPVLVGEEFTIRFNMKSGCMAISPGGQKPAAPKKAVHA